MNDITKLTLKETMEALKGKAFSEEELNKVYFDRISNFNPKLNAYLEVVEGNQKGIPAAIKDVIMTRGIKTTASSKILQNFIPPYNATVIDKLEEQGISIIGKTNHDEFAMGSSGENSAYGVTKNPWNLSKVPGGSSSGSAAAVASDLCVFALGSDTGGSIRQPASLCGVVGFKPTYGRVSRYGLIAMASSLDQIGPFTKSVADAAIITEWICGADGMDSNCRNGQWTMDNGQLNAGVKGVKVGMPKEYFEKGLDPKVKEIIQIAIKKLEQMGAEIVEISLPYSKYAVEVYYIIMSSEVSSNLARFDGVRYGNTRDHFGAEPKRRIMLGTYSLSSGYWDEYYSKAAKVRTLIKRDFEKVFDPSTDSGCDVIVGPVSPTACWDFGAKTTDPLEMYLSDIYTIPANLAGIPGLSVPCGFSGGLPVGLQILGRHWDEETVLRVGYAYEQVTNWHLKKPDL